MNFFKNRKVRSLIQIAQDFITSIFSTFLIGSLLNVFDSTFSGVIFAGLLAATRVSGNWILGSYKTLWRYTSFTEIKSIGLNCFLIMIFSTLAFIADIIKLSYAFIIVEGICCFLALGVLRGIRRLQLTALTYYSKYEVGHKKKTLILGGGKTTFYLIQDNIHNTDIKIVGILDDDESKHNALLAGVKIIGPTTKLEQYIKELDINHVIIAMNADRAIIYDLVSRARKARVSVKVIPSISNLISGDNRKNHFPYHLEDIVGSKEVTKEYGEKLNAKRNNRVLVTGGAGYIGTHLVEMLLNSGYSVRILDNFLYGREGLKKIENHPKLEIVNGDISNIRDVVKSVRDVGTVIALAALVGDPACGINAEETLNLNYESTKVLVDLANFYGVKRFVFASSCSVYGASDDSFLTETSSLNPVSLYARTRIMSEEVILERCGSMEPVILRLSTVFGLSDRMRFDLVVNTLTVRGIVNNAFQVFGGGQWRPFIHCKDVANAFYLAATADKKSIEPVIFNVGSTDMNYTITDVAKIVEGKLINVEAEYEEIIDDPRNYKVNFDRIHKYLGFKPEYTIEKGVVEMIKAIKNNDELKDFANPKFSNFQVF